MQSSEQWKDWGDPSSPLTGFVCPLAGWEHHCPPLENFHPSRLIDESLWFHFHTALQQYCPNFNGGYNPGVFYSADKEKLPTNSSLLPHRMCDRYSSCFVGNLTVFTPRLRGNLLRFPLPLLSPEKFPLDFAIICVYNAGSPERPASVLHLLTSRQNR